MKSIVFCYVTQCSLVEVYRRSFEETCLHSHRRGNRPILHSHVCSKERIRTLYLKTLVASFSVEKLTYVGDEILIEDVQESLAHQGKTYIRVSGEQFQHLL
jgi:hypothetical protein